MRATRGRLRPFFPYFGAKFRLAPKYPAPVFDRIIEPFAGSAQYALLYPERRVTLVDLNPKVTGTWDYLIHASEAEIAALPVYDGTWETTDDLTMIPEEARWLIGWWCNKGTVRPSRSPSRWMREAEDTGENYWGPGVKARILRQLPAIRHWKVREQSYETLKNKKATWFVDPPYQVAGKYPMRDINFQSLGEWCQERRGQVIVCENVGADWLPFEHFHDLKGTEGAYRSGISREAIWLGGRQVTDHQHGCDKTSTHIVVWKLDEPLGGV